MLEGFSDRIYSSDGPWEGRSDGLKDGLSDGADDDDDDSIGVVGC